MRKSSGGEAEANDRLAQRYFQIWENCPIQKFTHQVESIWMQEMVQPSQRVLLAGSGGGREIEPLIGRAGEIVALDISQEMLRVGQDRFPDSRIQWRIGDVLSPPEDLGSFDHILSLGGVFAYLENPWLAAQALAQRLRPGGGLTICVMNSDHPTESPGRKELNQGRVRQTYSVQEIYKLMEHAGLKMELVRGFRFLVDNLPAEWNKNPQAGAEIEGIMRRAIELEHRLLHLLPAEKGKFIWATARSIKV